MTSIKKVIAKYVRAAGEAKPPGSGWEKAGEHGGFRKPKQGGGFTYWYPSVDHAIKAHEYHVDKASRLSHPADQEHRDHYDGADQFQVQHINDHLDKNSTYRDWDKHPTSVLKTIMSQEQPEGWHEDQEYEKEPMEYDDDDEESYDDEYYEKEPIEYEDYVSSMSRQELLDELKEKYV